MRYWNSHEIIDMVLGIFFTRNDFEAIDSPYREALTDCIIDFCVDLVELHNFQIEKPDVRTNEDVARLIATFATRVSNWTVETFLDALKGMCDGAEDQT